MKPLSKHTYKEISSLCTRYCEEGEASLGGEAALEWYKRGVAFAKKGAEYDQKNYEYYYDRQKHRKLYERKGLKYFLNAAECFKNSAELGNEIAMMNHALYLFSFKNEEQESLKWFIAASDAGLAIADCELSVFYKKGYCGLEIDEEKAEYYYQRYKSRCEESERQAIFAHFIRDDRNVLGRSYMYGLFCGSPCPEVYDTPKAEPSKWKYRN